MYHQFDIFCIQFIEQKKKRMQTVQEQYKKMIIKLKMSYSSKSSNVLLIEKE